MKGMRYYWICPIKKWTGQEHPEAFSEWIQCHLTNTCKDQVKLGRIILLLVFVSYHNYADDTQIYVTAGEHGPVDTLCHWIEQISVWMQNNSLQLNSDKTEIIVCGPQKQRESVISHLETLSLKPRNQVRNLGVMLDNYQIKKRRKLNP